MTRTALLALFLLVALLGGAIFGLREWGNPVKGTAGPAPGTASPPRSAASSEPAPAPAAAAAQPAAPSRPAAAPAAPSSDPGGKPPSQGEALPAASLGPSFDIVRVGPDGSIVAAGRGKPGSSVLLMSSERELGRAPVDTNGEWVLTLPDIALPPGTHTLMLRQLEADRLPIASERTVVIVMPERRQGGPSIAMGPRNDGKAAPGKSASDAPAELPLVFSEPTRGGGGTTVMQSPVGPARAGDLTVATLDYDETGAIAVSGTAAPGTFVRAYVDDAIVGSAKVGPDGRWRIVASEGLAPGPHRLRVDRLDGQERVAGRLELPFVRQVPSGSAADPSAPSITIVRGDNLWNIARARYGDGFRYTVIFEANRGEIRDPNLIYPGQIFRMPAK